MFDNDLVTGMCDRIAELAREAHAKPFRPTEDGKGLYAPEDFDLDLRRARAWGRAAQRLINQVAQEDIVAAWTVAQRIAVAQMAGYDQYGPKHWITFGIGSCTMDVKTKGGLRARQGDIVLARYDGWMAGGVTFYSARDAINVGTLVGVWIKLVATDLNVLAAERDLELPWIGVTA